MVRAEYVGREESGKKEDNSFFFRLTDVSPAHRSVQFWYQRITGQPGSLLVFKQHKVTLMFSLHRRDIHSPK